MEIENLPIEIYVEQNFTDGEIVKLIENWRVEPEELKFIVISHFKELGIFQVGPGLSREIKETMIKILKTSPQVYQAVKKGERRAALLKGRRAS